MRVPSSSPAFALQAQCGMDIGTYTKRNGKRDEGGLHSPEGKMTVPNKE